MPRIGVDGGTELFCLVEGHSAGTPVVFVNGLTMDTSAWAAVAEPLGGDRPVVRYDCRGQGASDKPAGPYPPERHAADLADLLDALGIDRAHLVGLSNGGLVAAILAGRLADTAPRRILSLTMIDSFIGVDPLLRTILRGWRAALAAGGPGLRFDIATPWVWGHAFLARHLDEVLAFRERAESADGAAVLGLIEGLIDFGGAGDLLARYRGPLLALVGRDDLLTPPRYSREIATAAPQTRLQLLDDCGHAAPIESPEAVIAALRPLFAAAEGAP